MSTMTNAELEAISDPLAARAESESAKMPPSVDLPPGFQWNDAVTKEAARVEAMFDAWATANTALIEELDDYRAAIEADELALKKAIRDGADKHPGNTRTAKAREALEFALLRCTLARQDMTKEHQTGMLQKLMAQSVNELIGQAAEAKARIEKDTAAVIEITRQRFREINHDRAVVAGMVRFVAGVKNVRVDSTYGESLPDVRLPDGFQVRMTWADHVLETVDAAPKNTQ